MPELRKRKLRPVQEAIASEDQRVDISSAPVSLADVRESVLLGAESGGENQGRGARGGDAGSSDRTADAFFRADAKAQGLSLDEYKRKYGIMIRAADEGDRPRWEGSTSDPFERRKHDRKGDVEYLPRVVSLEEIAA